MPAAAVWIYSFFFFQAEDGIRVVAVTGVQTCALPIPGARVRRDRDAAGVRGDARRGGRRGPAVPRVRRPPLVHARRDRDARRAGRRPPGRGPDDDRERLGAPEKAAPAAPAPLRLVDPPRSHHGRGPLAGRLRARVPESVIVRLPNWLGDTVMAVPAIRALRQALDGERLLLAGPWGAGLGEQALADVLVPHPRSWSGRLSPPDTVPGLRGPTAGLLPTPFAVSASTWARRTAAPRSGIRRASWSSAGCSAPGEPRWCSSVRRATCRSWRR